DAIKAGDPGRVILVLKVRRTKYTYEMLHIIHNITHVWPKGIRDIALKNWLVNTTGRSYAFVEVDLMQEHMNYWIKMISPCVDILRHLTKSLNSVLGTNQGSRHAPPDLSKDIAAIMKSLKDHHVYQIKKGRVLDDDDTPVKDIIAAGLKELTDSVSNPLKEYKE
ncbi:hypothetical protein ARMSODRAFT_856122, partial [Armillaria solidipes]